MGSSPPKLKGAKFNPAPRRRPPREKDFREDPDDAPTCYEDTTPPARIQEPGQIDVLSVLLDPHLVQMHQILVLSLKSHVSLRWLLRLLARLRRSPTKTHLFPFTDSPPSRPSATRTLIPFRFRAGRTLRSLDEVVDAVQTVTAIFLAFRVFGLKRDGYQNRLSA